MSDIYKYQNKAVVSNGNTAVTVFGDAARAVNTIVIATVLTLALIVITKALK